MADLRRPVGARIRDHLQAVEEANAATLDAVASRMLEVVREDGLIFVGGTGHSLAQVLECFYRAGGLACVFPIYHPALLPLCGAQASTFQERVPGFGRLLSEQLPAAPGDLGFVFSHSGVNPVPVEMAEALREKGAEVVAVTSREHMARARARAPRKLDEVADHIIDTLLPYGDASYETGGGVRTMPLSSLAGIYVWNLLLGRLADLARGGPPLPLWTSANVEGAEARNRDLLARYRRRVPHL
jgi:uncharacterized phosphosugar-binding protein